METRKEMLGTEHPDMLISMSNLASVDSCLLPDVPLSQRLRNSLIPRVINHLAPHTIPDPDSLSAQPFELSGAFESIPGDVSELDVQTRLKTTGIAYSISGNA